MLRLLTPLLVLVCLARATFGVIKMWHCEVQESIKQSAGITVSITPGGYYYKAETPPTKQASSCTILPHGTCNYTLEQVISVIPMPTISFFDGSFIFHYKDFTLPRPTEPPRTNHLPFSI